MEATGVDSGVRRGPGRPKLGDSERGRVVSVSLRACVADAMRDLGEGIEARGLRLLAEEYLSRKERDSKSD